MPKLFWKSGIGELKFFSAWLWVLALTILFLLWSYLISLGVTASIGSAEIPEFFARGVLVLSNGRVRVQQGIFWVLPFVFVLIVRMIIVRRNTTKPGRIEILPFLSSSGKRNEHTNLVSSIFRSRLEQGNIGMDPRIVPGSQSPPDLVQVVQEKASVSKGWQEFLLSVVPIIVPGNAYKISGMLIERSYSPRFGIITHIAHCGYWNPYGTSITTWSDNWRSAAEESASGIISILLAYTTMGRQQPWTNWQGKTIPSGLVNNYIKATELSRAQRYDEALDRFYAALMIDPVNASIRVDVAYLHEQLGLFMDALETYLATMRLSISPPEEAPMLEDLPKLQLNPELSLHMPSKLEIFTSKWISLKEVKFLVKVRQWDPFIPRYRYLVNLGFAVRMSTQWHKEALGEKRTKEKEELKERLYPILTYKYAESFVHRTGIHPSEFLRRSGKLQFCGRFSKTRADSTRKQLIVGSIDIAECLCETDVEFLDCVGKLSVRLADMSNKIRPRFQKILGEFETLSGRQQTVVLGIIARAEDLKKLCQKDEAQLYEVLSSNAIPDEDECRRLLEEFDPKLESEAQTDGLNFGREWCKLDTEYRAAVIDVLRQRGSIASELYRFLVILLKTIIGSCDPAIKSSSSRSVVRAMAHLSAENLRHLGVYAKRALEFENRAPEVLTQLFFLHACDQERSRLFEELTFLRRKLSRTKLTLASLRLIKPWIEMKESVLSSKFEDDLAILLPKIKLENFHKDPLAAESAVNQCLGNGKRNASRSWLDHYNAACVYAIGIGPRRDFNAYSVKWTASEDKFAKLAVQHLTFMCRGDHSEVASKYREWLLVDDPDLVAVRPHPEFMRFEAQFFPSQSAPPPRNSKIHQIRASRYLSEVLAQCGSVMSARWKDRARRLDNEWVPVSDQLSWWQDERRIWEAVGNFSRNSRHWQSRVELVNIVNSTGMGDMPFFVPYRGIRNYLTSTELPDEEFKRELSRKEQMAKHLDDLAQYLPISTAHSRELNFAPHEQDVVCLTKKWIHHFTEVQLGKTSMMRSSKSSLSSARNQSILWHTLFEWFDSQELNGAEEFAKMLKGNV